MTVAVSCPHCGRHQFMQHRPTCPLYMIVGPNNVANTAMYAYRLESANRLTTIKAAIERAVFLLRAEGNGPYDAEQARVLESLRIGDPG